MIISLLESIFHLRLARDLVEEATKGRGTIAMDCIDNYITGYTAALKKEEQSAKL